MSHRCGGRSIAGPSLSLARPAEQQRWPTVAVDGRLGRALASAAKHSELKPHSRHTRPSVNSHSEVDQRLGGGTSRGRRNQPGAAGPAGGRGTSRGTSRRTSRRTSRGAADQPGASRGWRRPAHRPAWLGAASVATAEDPHDHDAGDGHGECGCGELDFGFGELAVARSLSRRTLLAGLTRSARASMVRARFSLVRSISATISSDSRFAPLLRGPGPFARFPWVNATWARGSLRPLAVLPVRSWARSSVSAIYDVPSGSAALGPRLH